jgi:site-specific recombinase XerD
MCSDSKIDGLVGDIMTQAEFLRTAMEMMLFLKEEEISETRRLEIRRGVRFFLNFCIDTKPQNVDANAVDAYLRHLLKEGVSKTTFFHLFSVLQYFFNWTSEVEGVFPDITAGINPEYRIKKVRRIKRGRGSND